MQKKEESSCRFDSPASPSISQSSSCCSTPHGQKMYSERKGVLHLVTSLEGRIALIGTCLAFIHSAGLVISLYYLISNYLSSDSKEDDPYTHVCTDALLCILFRFGPGKDQTGQTNTALAGQMLYSLLAICINLLLVGGALGRRLVTLVAWLLFYLLNILGCFVLTGVLAATLVHRHNYYGDLKIEELAWICVPVLLAILYLLVWICVLILAIKFRRHNLRMFSIDE